MDDSDIMNYDYVGDPKEWRDACQSSRDDQDARC